MANSNDLEGTYLHAYNAVIQTLQRLADPIDVYKIDRVIARLDYLCRLLVNEDNNGRANRILFIIENAIESLRREIIAIWTKCDQRYLGIVGDLYLKQRKNNWCFFWKTVSKYQKLPSY